jgi:hypothetical protein
VAKCVAVRRFPLLVCRPLVGELHPSEVGPVLPSVSVSAPLWVYQPAYFLGEAYHTMLSKDTWYVAKRPYQYLHSF